MSFLTKMFNSGTNPFKDKAVVPFLAGKKTYIMLGLIVACGVAEAFGYQVPMWLWTVLGAGTVAAHKASIDRIASVVQDLGGMVTYTADQTSLTNARLSAVQSAVSQVKQATQTPAYETASEEKKTEMLNESQLTNKGN